MRKFAQRWRNSALFPRNSGLVWKGKLLCAHSNYPQLPEKSEVKVLDPLTLKLTTFKSLGDRGGSLTWIVRLHRAQMA